MSSPPAILLAFANDWVHDRRHLRALLEESKAISEVLAPLVEDGRLGMPAPIHNATIDDVLASFGKPRYRDRIRILHFGGHASGSTLMFEDQAGAPTAAHARGLAGYLGKQRGLVLVFLNGCSTEGQVRALRSAGVKAVVATTTEIQDAVAAELARAFYAELASRPLREAFETAQHVVRVRRGDDPRAVTRDADHSEELGPPPWPWILDCDPAYEGWTLCSERPRSSRQRRLLGVTAAMSLLLVTSLTVSAGGGEGPTAAEQARWDDALAQDSCDGLRAYLRAHPGGVYADEARSRLAGSWIEETLGPPRDVRYVLTVSPRRSLPTEDAARRDALARGDQDAATTCAPRAADPTVQLLTARAEARDWRCDESAGGFRCGFDGEIVCRVQNRIRLERCR